MATQTDISDIIDDNGTQTAPEDTATKQNTQQSRSNSIDGEWEKKYKGLQGVIAKRDAEIANLRSEVSTNQITIEEQKRHEYFTLKEVHEMTRVKHPAMVAYAHIIGLLEMCGMVHISSGKTRETFANPKHPELRYILATDRISIFDIVLLALILFKGAVLTAMTVYWLKNVFKDIPNHLVAYGCGINEYLPTDKIRKLIGEDGLLYLQRHMIVVKKAKVVKVEAIVRGYLTGSGLKEYKKSGKVCGIQLPEGLVDGSKLPESIFTPSTKADYGEHDENISFERAVELVGFETMDYIRKTALEIYGRAVEEAEKVGIIIADTKFEFGILPDGTIILIDEILTPDSSRFWPKDGRLRAMEKNETPPSMDKQPVRNAGEKGGINSGRSWIPSVDLCGETSDNYMQIAELLTGEPLDDFWISEMDL